MEELKRDPSDVHVERGNQSSNQGKTEQARKEWVLAIQHDPIRLDAHSHIHIRLRESGLSDAYSIWGNRIKELPMSKT
jgi:hypothetical protein